MLIEIIAEQERFFEVEYSELLKVNPDLAKLEVGGYEWSNEIRKMWYKDQADLFHETGTEAVEPEVRVKNG